MLANQGIIFVCKVSLIYWYTLFGFVFTMCPMHMDCIYLVPSISSFHIVYFCGMCVPVKIADVCFYFELAIYLKTLDED